jgi:hypothetical protein
MAGLPEDFDEFRAYIATPTCHEDLHPV